MKIGVLGLGIMGTEICKNLLMQGHEVFAYNRTQKIIEAENNFKIRYYSTPQEVAENTEITIAMLSDENAVKEILYKKNGWLDGAKPGTAFINMSTVSPLSNIYLEQELQKVNCHFIEAPVLGSKTALVNKSVVVLTGACSVDLAVKYNNLFMALGKKIHYCSSTGNAAKVKLAINYLLATMTLGLAKALALAACLNVNQQIVMDAIADSSLHSVYFDLKGNLMLQNNFEPQFPLKHLVKDLSLADAELQHGDSWLESVLIQFERAFGNGMGDEDVSAVYKLYKQ